MVMFKTIQLELFFGFLLTLSGIAVAFPLLAFYTISR